MKFKLLAALIAAAFLVACGGGDDAKKGAKGAKSAEKSKASKKGKKSNLANWDTLSNDRLVELGHVFFG